MRCTRSHKDYGSFVAGSKFSGNGSCNHGNLQHVRRPSPDVLDLAVLNILIMVYYNSSGWFSVRVRGLKPVVFGKLLLASKPKIPNPKIHKP